MKTKISNFNGYLRYANDELFLEEVSCKSLAEKIRTPFYCYSLSEIEDNFYKLKNSFSKINPLICYAVKANHNALVINLVSRLGLGVDVVSKGEMVKSLNNGITPDKVVFSGVGKTEEEIKFAIKKKIKQINVESEEELDEIDKFISSKNQKINICLRVNPNVNAKTHEKVSTGRSEDKFGIPLEKIKSIFQNYRDKKSLSLMGLTVHIGSQIEEITPFEESFKVLRKLVGELLKMNCKIKSLDLGGGIGINYNGDFYFPLQKYAKLVEKYFSDLSVEIILEPGRFLVGSAGILVSSVIRKKIGAEKNFIILDSGMNNFLRPSLYNAYHKILPVTKENVQSCKFDIVGPICESGDIFARNVQMQDLKKDDLVVICSVGAYGSCMSSNYNLRGVAKEIFVKGNKTIE